MDELQLRENEVFNALKEFKGLEFVIIGGYATNAYTLPRFSVDCDIVIKGRGALAKFADVLPDLGYKKRNFTKVAGSDGFARYEKMLSNAFRVSFDILIGEVFDRQSKVSIPAQWIFKNSSVIALKGKTIKRELKVRIINVDALFVMKMLSCRSTDIRDMFMLAPMINDRAWVRQEVAARYNFKARLGKLTGKITSKEFRDGLQGVYGAIDDRAFERSVGAVLVLGG